MKSSLFKHRNFNKWLGFLVALCIVLFTIWSSNSIVQKLKVQEQKRMETIVKAIELQGNSITLSDETRALTLKISEDNTSMPMILMDEAGVLSDIRNLEKQEERLRTDAAYLHKVLGKMAKQHTPIEVELPFGTQKIYYENSLLLSQLRYYPIVLVLIILGFAAFTIWYFRTLNESQKSFLWAGMAKETAHQIGTPLSSLMGWIALLRLEEVDESIVDKMDSDVTRLKQIAERFSKIGSVPELKKHDIIQIIENSYDYLKPRISSGVDFQLRAKADQIMVMCNPELLSWVLENLIKNAVDAMQNRGKVELKVAQQNQKVIISISDNGPGIPTRLQKRIFEPGYTTKKRGWGLGLSLAKRIINDYHRGRIYVKSSDKDAGTVINIELDIS
ncbi:GHKL domain-containing protein [Flavobacteriaceae bacterium Ap0902]|nr:GHKL domain-containing protein [Flavobacteriaceae bacterium Ap0902]